MPHLQLPDAFAVTRNICDSLAHERNEHVEQKNVSEDHKEKQQEHDEVSESGMFLEIQVAHPNGDLEELQGDTKQPTVHSMAPSTLQLSKRLVLRDRRSIPHQRNQSYEKNRIWIFFRKIYFLQPSLQPNAE